MTVNSNTTNRLTTILITGINGYIAAHTARVFLQAGFSVRGTVRNAHHPNTLSLTKALSKYDGSNRLEIVQVPDITAHKAFDHAVQGVSAIAHLASPVSMTATDPEPMMRAAVEGTTSLLSSAASASSEVLKSIVFMSSISAVYSPEADQGQNQHQFTSQDWNRSAEQDVARLGDKTPGYVIYQASKSAAERAFWRFAEENEPPLGWGMASVCPAPTIGPPLFLPTPIETLSMRAKDIHTIYHGGGIPELSGTIRATFVDVRDVADIVFGVITKHLGLQQHTTTTTTTTSPPQEQQTTTSSSGPTRQERLICVAAENVSPAQMASILRETYPDRRNIIPEPDREEDSTILAKLASHLPSTGRKFDSEPARRYMGRDWVGFKQSVLDNAKAFVDAESASSS
ncbi:putative oxidoreductase [Podospora australis]|uniref:Oxidoreductase n=1 Tax=Podospora australis TaxID=1536484 RepID=A0AAN6WQ62_9PEZI|nr:putative oxidoreductase [Podospora australis]